MSWLTGLSILGLPFLATTGGLCIAAMLYLLLRRPSWRWTITSLLAIVVGVAIALLSSWYVADVLNTFDAPVTPQQQAWIVLAFVGIMLASVNFRRSRWWRKVIAAISIPLLLITGAAYVNASIGYYATIGDALGINPFQSGSLASQTGIEPGKTAAVTKHWTAPFDQPEAGETLTVKIPGTHSGFKARPAVLYLPPAALVQNPPVLPVIILMSGQPGNPTDWFTSGKINRYFNTYAAAHNGIAPIVISPDQLGNPGTNPMCVDSPLGNVRTYITVDVVDWIKTHLRVSTDRSAWAVGGFSEGATCATQFLTGDSKIFGSMLGVSSELMPRDGAATVPVAFGGSKAAYHAAWPLNVMKQNAPYTDTVAYFAVGALDEKYLKWARKLTAAANASGIHAHLYVSPGTAHDWYTVAYGVKNGMPRILQHMGLAP